MLKIKLLHPDAKVPTRVNATDAGLDMYSAEQWDIVPGGRLQIPTRVFWSPIVVDELDETERGESGFGSSGK